MFLVDVFYVKISAIFLFVSICSGTSWQVVTGHGRGAGGEFGSSTPCRQHHGTATGEVEQLNIQSLQLHRIGSPPQYSRTFCFELFSESKLIKTTDTFD
jgi:hypothetical protein